MLIKKILSGVLALTLITSTIAFAENISLNPEIRVPELKPIALNQENITELEAYNKAQELLSNIKFADISTDSNKEDIYKLSAEGVFVKYDNENFYPNQNVSKLDTITYLVRMLGNEGVIQERLIGTAEGMSSDAYKEQLNNEYIDEAITLGVLDATEDFNLEKSATREEIAIFISRALNLAPEFADQNIVYSFNDFAGVQPLNRGIIESVITDKYMEVDSVGNFNSEKLVTKSEIANIFAEVSKTLFPNRNITENIGIVTGTNTLATGEKVYVLRDLDGALSQIKVVNSTNPEIKTDFVTVKNGVVGNSTAVALGDELEYLTRDGKVFFAKVLPQSTIIKAQAALTQAALTESETDIRVYFGTVYSKTVENHYQGDKQVSIDRLRIHNHNGQIFDFVVETDIATGICNDINVIKNQASGGVDLLQNGDFIEYIVKDGNALLLVKAKPLTTSTVKGNVQYVDRINDGQTMITVIDYNDNIVRYPIAEYADITMNSEVGTPADFQYGQDITLSIQNGMVIYAAAETFVNPGYIPVNGKMRMGRIESVSNGYMTVLYDDSSKDTLLVNDMAIIREGGNIISTSQLNAGDRVKIYFSDIYSQVPTKIEVEGPEQLITGVYKGKLFKVNRANKTVVLTQADKLENNQWISTGQFSMDIQLDETSNIYYNGQSIPFTLLTANMQGMDLYVAVKDSYNKNQAVQVSVKNGGERLYYSGIADLNSAVQRFEMDNRTNVNYNDGTIFVRDNRLVTKSSLTTNENALIVSNYKNGLNTASVVELHGVSNILHNPYRVYLGHVETVYSSMFVLENGASMSNYNWSEADDDNIFDFAYGTETVITDVTEDDPETISEYGFFHGSYMREENEDEDGEGLDYERYYAFVVANQDGEALSVMLRKEALIEGKNIDDEIDRERDVEDELNDQIKRFIYTKGQIVSIDTGWSRIELKNSYDWLENYQEWNDNRTNIYIEIGDTIIMKNDKQIDFEDVEVGDRVQAVRLNEDALVLFVE